MSFLASILEIAACAAAAGLTSYFVLEKREARHHAAAKAEELYSLLEAFEQGLVAHFVRICALIAEGCAYAPAQDPGWEKLTREAARARMLVSFYFPALWPHMKRADGTVAAAVAAMRRHHANPRDEQAILGFEQSVFDMREAVQSLKHAVVMAHRDRGRRLAARRPMAAEALRMAA